MNRNIEWEFKERLEELVEGYGEGNQTGVKEALNLCQELFGCVSVAHTKTIANEFNVAQAIVNTFIKLSPSIKTSIVENEVVCCSGPRCSANGSMAVIKSIKDELGISFDETTPDGKIRLSSQNCFKHCGKGPNVMVNGEILHHLDDKKAKEVIKGLKK